MNILTHINGFATIGMTRWAQFQVFKVHFVKSAILILFAVALITFHCDGFFFLQLLQSVDANIMEDEHAKVKEAALVNK